MAVVSQGSCSQSSLEWTSLWTAQRSGCVFDVWSLPLPRSASEQKRPRTSRESPTSERGFPTVLELSVDGTQTGWAVMKYEVTVRVTAGLHLNSLHQLTSQHQMIHFNSIKKVFFEVLGSVCVCRQCLLCFYRPHLTGNQKVYFIHIEVAAAQTRKVAGLILHHGASLKPLSSKLFPETVSCIHHTPTLKWTIPTISQWEAKKAESCLEKNDIVTQKQIQFIKLHENRPLKYTFRKTWQAGTISFCFSMSISQTFLHVENCVGSNDVSFCCWVPSALQ